MEASFVLIHSPLVGPMTWSRVADELQQSGHDVVRPVLAIPEQRIQPHWVFHRDVVLAAVGDETGLVLVGHSGAGALLPAIGEALQGRIAAYVIVDGVVPEHGASRFDLFASPQYAEQWRRSAVDDALPPWSEDVLKDVIHDAEIRQRFAAELRPVPIAVYEEPLPVFEGWPDAPCAYLHFTSGYDEAADKARQLGWAYRKLEGSHFHMLNEPASVAAALIELVHESSKGSSS